MQELGAAKHGLVPALQEHWDKLILAGVATAFAAFLVSQVFDQPTAANSVDTAARDFLANRLVSNPTFASPNPPPAVEIRGLVAASTAPECTHGLPPPVDKGPGPRPGAVVFFLPELILGTLQASRDGVELRWSLSGEPKLGEKPVSPATFFYLLERRKKGALEWEALKKELKNTNHYVDESAAPRTEYEYQVTLGSMDPAWGAKNPTRLSTHVGGPLPATTPGIWEFHFENVTPAKSEDVPPLPATVYVKIVKFDREFGRVEWRGIHKDKTRIGLADGTYIHSVWSEKKGRTIEVDFNSGAAFLSIEADKLVSYLYKACVRKPGPGGLVCTGTELRKDFHRVHVLSFTDEVGTKQVVEKSGAARRPDDLCPEHRGRDR